MICSIIETPKHRLLRVGGITCFASPLAFFTLLLLTTHPILGANDHSGAERYREQIAPILENRCYDCHGDGSDEGSLTLDEFNSDNELLNSRELWWKVLKNVRAGIMPPKRKPRLSEMEMEQLTDWVETDVFGIDPVNPDPGRITVRRLNRVEYRNTIRDLMGINFDAEAVFPPDDTGYGFDNIGDVLSISPLLLEKYLAAAETIVEEAVPLVATVAPTQVVNGSDFRTSDDSKSGDALSFYQPTIVQHMLNIDHAGEYRLFLEVHVGGEFAFDPGRCRALFSVDGKERVQDEFGWEFSDDPDRGKAFHYEFTETLTAGEHQLALELLPLVSEEEKINRLNFRINTVIVEGPQNPDYWVPTERYARFFPEGPAAVGVDERRQYATRLLKEFAALAFRRPPDPKIIQLLVSMAEDTYTQPDKSFEQGVARAMVGVLASPRFLFRTERNIVESPGMEFPFVDEYALASRLSYFLWSTMPDKELFRLAEQGHLREELPAQVDRMLRDPRSSALIRNFTGQWLQVRNIDHTAIEPLEALGFQEEMDQLREKFGRRLWRNAKEDADPDLKAARARSAQLRKISSRFNGDLRESMRRETEMVFEYAIRENRSVLDFIDSNYTFLNQPLAEHYGIPGIEGDEMRFVKLPSDSPRGGVLTQGTMLTVTSNPTRTSPVKRGLFILENILGTPSPPAPPNIPSLEESAMELADHEPTLREILARHREDALCSSCHSRIDPLGIAFENFTALGTWRDTEAAQPIDASGKLITGESFASVRELKTVLKEKYRANFYRCLSEKLLTYALGRGLEYYDEFTVDQIVNQLENQEGQFMALISGIIESAPFQKRRNENKLNASIPDAHDALVIHNNE